MLEESQISKEKEGVNIPLVLLFVFFGVVQIYIFLLPGVKGYYKNFLNSSGMTLINGLLYNVYIPAYSILEVSRMASITNVKSYWFLAISVTICIFIRMFLSYVLNIIIGSDKKTSHPYAMLNTFPAVGSLTLVLGKAMCYKGCPLYGDPLCEDVLGLMMVNYLIYSVLVFVTGFIIHANALKNYSIVKEKLRFLWYRFISLSRRDDIIPRYFIYKYINFSNKKAEDIYIDFISNNKLIVDELFNYTYEEKNKKNENATEEILTKMKSFHVSNAYLNKACRSRSVLHKEDIHKSAAEINNLYNNNQQKIESKHNEIKKNYFKPQNLIEKEVAENILDSEHRNFKSYITEDKDIDDKSKELEFINEEDYAFEDEDNSYVNDNSNSEKVKTIKDNKILKKAFSYTSTNDNFNKNKSNKIKKTTNDNFKKRITFKDNNLNVEKILGLYDGNSKTKNINIKNNSSTKLNCINIDTRTKSFNNQNNEQNNNENYYNNLILSKKKHSKKNIIKKKSTLIITHDYNPYSSYNLNNISNKFIRNLTNKEHDKELKNNEISKFKTLIYKSSQMKRVDGMPQFEHIIDKDLYQGPIKSIYVQQKIRNNLDNAFNIIGKHNYNKWFFGENQKFSREYPIRRTKSFEVFRNQKRNEYYKLLKEKNKIEDDPVYIDKQIISKYYNKLFLVIKNELTAHINDIENNNIDDTLDKKTIKCNFNIKSLFSNNSKNGLYIVKNKDKIFHDLNIEKELILSHIEDDIVPKFHAVDALHMSKKDLDILDVLWDEYEELVIEGKQLVGVTLHVNVFTINAKMILKKILNPPVVSCIIGIFIGMSGLREILFSKNHYLVNLFELVTITAKAYVPLLFAAVGYTLMIAPKFNKNFTLTKLQFWMSFFNCYIVYPAIGIGIMYVWIHGYGGIVANSKVFRFCLFIPFCVPVSPNFVIVINILDKYYLEEYGYAMAKHFYSMIITTTILILIYFVIIN